MKFIKFNKYNNDKRKKDIFFFSNSSSCWAVTEKDLDNFLKNYWDHDPVILDSSNKIAFAYNYRMVDDYVTDKSFTMPLPIVFNENYHQVICKNIMQLNRFWGNDDEMNYLIPYFETPFQVILKNADDEGVKKIQKNLENNMNNELILLLLNKFFSVVDSWQDAYQLYLRGYYWESVILTCNEIQVDGFPVQTFDDIIEYIETNFEKNDDVLKLSFIHDFNNSKVVYEATIEDIVSSD